MSGLFSLLPCLIEIPVSNANGVDQDQTPRSAASDLDLHCLPMSLLWDALGITGLNIKVKATGQFVRCIRPLFGLYFFLLQVRQYLLNQVGFLIIIRGIRVCVCVCVCVCLFVCVCACLVFSCTGFTKDIWTDTPEQTIYTQLRRFYNVCHSSSNSRHISE